MSVRLRTTLAATIVVGVALALAAIGLLVVQRAALVKHLDEVIDLRVNDIAALAREGPLPPLLVAGNDDDEQVTVLDDEGGIVAQSPGPGAVRTFEPAGDDATIRTIDGWRVAARTVDGVQGSLRIYINASLEPVDESITLLATSLAIGGPLLLALVALTTWFAVGRALRPVDAIRRQVDEISGRSLDRRVPVPASGDEIARLASTMNMMLDRVEGAAKRQRRFVADASHELRTPLAAVRADLEVGGSAELLATTARMERLVDDLLYLARADEGAAPPPPVLVDLDDVVLEEAAGRRVHARVPIDTGRVSAAPVLGRRDDLRRVVANLLDNAVRHAATGVAVSVSSADGSVSLVVADDGPGIPPGDRTRVFERFARVDDARDRGRGGSGLGLAIAREIVTGHGGSIAATDEGIVVVLPAA